MGKHAVAEWERARISFGQIILEGERQF